MTDEDFERLYFVPGTTLYRLGDAPRPHPAGGAAWHKRSARPNRRLARPGCDVGVGAQRYV
jgi:hypothetical protein